MAEPVWLQAVDDILEHGKQVIVDSVSVRHTVPDTRERELLRKLTTLAALTKIQAEEAQWQAMLRK